ncbi:MAG: hypothetical protein JSU92_13630 [Deltaproteobacteria bacterium]|nr:MAG: hypothetical protein JSU92_13630 [Deltaproteobacteria bacterium]
MIKFGRKERLRVFKRVVWVGLTPFIGVWLLSFFNINPKDPTFFDKEYTASYRAEGEIFKPEGILEIKSRGKNTLRVIKGAFKQDFMISEKEHSIFWVYWPNPVVSLRSKVDNAISSAKVVDYPGILGRPGATYKMVMKERIILWSRVLDSQASYRIGLIDGEGREIATGIYDATCGLLFRLEGHTGSLSVLELEETDFPISRNRNWQGLIAFLWGIGVLAYQFLFLRRKVTEETRTLYSLENELVIFGVIAIWIDAFYDIWFFHYLWTPGLVVIHVLAVAYVFWRFGWWGIFPLFELAWASAYMGGKESLVPQLTFFPGLIVTWVACLLFQDFRRRLKEGEK